MFSHVTVQDPVFSPDNVRDVVRDDNNGVIDGFWMKSSLIKIANLLSHVVLLFSPVILLGWTVLSNPACNSSHLYQLLE